MTTAAKKTATPKTKLRNTPDSYACGNCQGKGHNKRTCAAAPKKAPAAK